MPRNAERLQDCFIKVIENRNYSEQRIRAHTELPHIYYLSLDSVGTKLLRVCVHSPASPGSACACERRTYSTRVQTPFNNPQAGRMRLGPNDASPGFSDLLRATTGNRGRLHTEMKLTRTSLRMLSPLTRCPIYITNVTPPIKLC